MRGPSSSHSVAALRIGRICRDLMLGDPDKVVVSYDAGDALSHHPREPGIRYGNEGRDCLVLSRTMCACLIPIRTWPKQGSIFLSEYATLALIFQTSTWFTCKEGS